MTVLDAQDPQDTGPHPGELKLRRFRAGELDAQAAQEITRHASRCPPCRSKLRLLQEEESRFQQQIPFERFAGGVERALRVPRPRRRRHPWAWGGGLGAAAVAAVMLLLAWPTHTFRPQARNRTMGAAVSALARVASATGGAQHAVLPDSDTILRPGDRIRLGYEAVSAMHLLSLSVDDAGQMTALYPERGPSSLAVGPTLGARYLPDSLELTGQGRERVFLFLARRPFQLNEAEQAVRAAYLKAKGDLGALPAPVFEGRNDVQPFSWLFHKP